MKRFFSQPTGWHVTAAAVMLIPFAVLRAQDDSQPPVVAEVTATDAGEPPQSSSTTVSINVVEDSALHTYYVGYFDEDGQPEAFLYNRATNERTIAHPGEQIVVADIDAEVAHITPEHLELTIGSRTFHLSLGESLRQLLLVRQEAPSNDAEDK